MARRGDRLAAMSTTTLTDYTTGKEFLLARGEIRQESIKPYFDGAELLTGLAGGPVDGMTRHRVKEKPETIRGLLGPDVLKG